MVAPRTARLPSWSAGAVVLAALAQPAWAAGPPALAATSQAADLPRVGLSLDVGLPDGAIAALVVRPLPWLRLAGGGGSNGSALGMRLGATILPFGAGPSLTLEAGGTREGDATTVLPFLRKSASTEVLQHVSYQYGNAQLGLDFGRRRAAFFVHAGLSYVHASFGGSGAVLQRVLSGASSGQEVRVLGDATAHAIIFAGKAGLVVFLD
jgi:hypothetical protein